MSGGPLLFYARSLEIEAKMGKHVRRWMESGMESCESKLG